VNDGTTAVHSSGFSLSRAMLMTSSLLQRAKKELGASIVPITVEQYHLMMKTGILMDGAPIELIDGMLVLKDRSARGQSEGMISPRHATGISKLDQFLQTLKSPGYFRRMRSPSTLGSTQEPEPDGAVVRGTIDNFTLQHPGPRDLLAVMEVSLSSLSYDRGTKLNIYARAGIPLYVIVNLNEDVVEVLWEPSESNQTYEQQKLLKIGDVLKLEFAPGVAISTPVAELIPPPGE